MSTFPRHRRLRVPVRLRGECADRPRRRGRVALPAPPRLAERVRRAARPLGGVLPVRADRAPTCPTSGATCPAPTCSRPPGTRRPGGSPCGICSWSGPRPPTSGASGTAACPATPCPGHAAAHRDVLQRAGRGAGELRPAVRLRPRPAASGPTTTAATTGHRVASGDLALDLTGSVRLGILGPRTYGRTTLENGRVAWLALSWDGDSPTTEDEAMAQLARHREVLARLARRRHDPRPPRGGPTSSAARSRSRV